MTRRWCLLAGALCACAPREPGDAAIRDQAALRGLAFLWRVADNPEHFARYGTDLMWAFYTLSEASADPYFRQQARAQARLLANRWRAAHPVIPPDVSVAGLYNMVSGSETTDALGVIDDRMRLELGEASRRFTSEDYLLFNPALEPPPSDIPAPCRRCEKKNERGAKSCRQCGQPLAMLSRYDILFDALLTTYAGHRYGVWLGGEFADVLRWLPSMRPYPPPANGRLADDFSATYAVTHIVYTLNDYSRYRLRPEWLPEEFRFLQTHARKAIDENDAETLGEFIESLQSFGMTESDAIIRNGIDYLITHQNPDGSWGDHMEPDIYTRYHTTWTGIGGVMRYGRRREAVTDPDGLRGSQSR